MGFAIALAVIYVVVVYLVFVKFKWLKFSIVWGIVSFWIGFHLLLVFVIGMRFYAPYTIDAHIIRNTIQLVPRLEGPTILTEVLVQPNEPVKKGQPLYKFDTSTYDEKLKGARAQLAAAEQNIAVMQADVEAAASQLAQAEAELAYARQQQVRFNNLASQGGARQEDVDKWNAEVESDTAAVAAASSSRPRSPGLVKPAALWCPPPPLARAMRSTLTAPRLRSETLISPPDSSRNRATARTPSIDRGWSINPSESPATAPERSIISAVILTVATRPSSWSSRVWSSSPRSLTTATG